ncbi:hypothetical protein JTB14_015378 [Gonioctena quinquepunctata]|nr:hypothetical protein JTB14_015378 [Gonioctena quinquepunctata]
MGSRKQKRSREDGAGTFDPMSVRWLEKYDKTVTKIWNKIPQSVGHFLATIATFAVGISINGDWLNIFVHAGKQFGFIDIQKSTTKSYSPKNWTELTLEDFYLKDLGSFMIWSCSASYAVYFGIGGFLHWYYYVRQRDRAEEWKCQPNKWLSPELERHEIMLGSLTLFVTATIGAILACYVANGGYSRVYYHIEDYGWLWFFLQFPVVYIYMVSY